MPAAFARFAPNAELGVERAGFGVGAWLRAISAPGTINELASKSGLSRFAISRWLSGQRQPRLPDFFRLVDAATGRLPDLIAELVPITEVPAVAKRYAMAQAARRIAFDEPWTEAILRVLETPAYAALRAHRPGVLAERLGISREQEARTLALLQTCSRTTCCRRRSPISNASPSCCTRRSARSARSWRPPSRPSAWRC